MELNISGLFNPEGFFIMNSAILIGLSVVLALPALVLNVVCMVALFLAKAVNLQMRVVLINAIAAEILYSIGSYFLYVGYPIRAWIGDKWNTSCRAFYSILYSYVTATLLSTIFCAVMIHRFIKYGKKKLNWKMMNISITLMWIASFIVGFGLYLGDTQVSSHLGFCLPGDLLIRAVRFSIIAFGIFGCFCFVLVFSILTHRHMKRNAPSSNSKVKKAVFNILLYHAIKTAIFLVQFMSPAIASSVQQYFEDRESDTTKLVVVLTIFLLNRVIFDIQALLFPLISMFILKPLLDALKNASKLMCSFCGKLGCKGGGGGEDVAEDAADATKGVPGNSVSIL